MAIQVSIHERKMIIKLPQIGVPENDPFANDLLQREENAEILTQFVTSSNEPMVICIDAPWGQGKTTFLRMWEQHLKNNHIPTLYFNAWENDFSDDALVCLIGEISSSIDEISQTGDKSNAKKHFNKAKKLGVTLLKQAIPVGAKLATAGVIDFDKITEKALSDFAEKIAQEQLEKYEKAKKTLGAFRATLADFAKSVTSKDSPKPLVFIIDELDRCRPNFAIEILEKAKHFFNVDNIVFVLAADKEQLGISIKAIYGNDLNVNGYLRRFIDFDYLLPKPESERFLKALFEKFSFQEYFSQKTGGNSRYKHGQALTMFSELSEAYNLTLREQEHCCSLLSLSIRTTPTDFQLFPIFLCFLIVLKIKNPGVYKQLISRELSPDDLLDSLRNDIKTSSILKSNYGPALETYIVTSQSHRHELREIVENYNEKSAAGQLEKERADQVIEIIRKFDWNGGSGALEYLAKKIEIASQFSS